MPTVLFPQRRRATLRFAQQSSLTSGAALTVGARVVLFLNDLFSPIAGTHQPYGFDQLALLYRRYKVDRTRVRMSITAPPSTGTSWTMIRAAPTGSTATLVGASIGGAIERPDTVYLQSVSGGGPTRVFDKTFNLHEVAGISKQQYDSDISEYSALVGASPTRRPFIEYAAGSIAASVITAVLVEVFFECSFFDAIIQTGS